MISMNWTLLTTRENRRYFVRPIEQDNNDVFYITEDDSDIVRKTTITELKNGGFRNTNLLAYDWEAEKFEKLVNEFEVICQSPIMKKKFMGFPKGVIQNPKRLLDNL
jgi:hypothetical protein